MSKINIIPERVELNIGETQLFTGEAFDDYGNPIPEASFSWEDGDAGTVSEDGTFSAGTEAGEFNEGLIGKAELGSSYAQNSPVIVIKPDPLDTAILEKLTIPAGESKQLVAIAKDKYGNVIDNLDVTWSMLDSKAGTITSEGLFTA